VILFGAALAIGIGLLLFRTLAPLQFADGKRDVRQALGLPKLWVRDFNDDTSSYQKVACPGSEAIVIVTGGQSNAANALADPQPSDPAVRAVMMENGACFALRDPVLRATGAGGSLWTELGAALHRATGRPIVFINSAVGGSQIGDWLDDRSGYRARLVDEINRARAIGLTPNIVLWVQGETDAAVRIPPAAFVAQLQGLVDRVDAARVMPRDVPWIVYRSTHCGNRPNNGADLDRAVEAFTAESKRVRIGPLASALDDSERYDGCHFNGRGRAALTQAVLPILLPLVGPPKKPVTYADSTAGR
jgi:hypothetical protein